MGVESVLFGIVGIIAIASAAMMLLSEKPVHSAMFLVLNFMCIAFFYLMLEAPFLAMVQIAVYAGAIMVLFLFVIMLLGADRLPEGEQVRRFPRLNMLGVGLAVVFLVVASLAVMGGNVSTQSAPSTQAFLRVVNAAPFAEEIPAVADESDAVAVAQYDLATRNFDVFVNGEVVAEDLYSGATSEFITLSPGEYTLTFSPINTAIEAASLALTLTAGQTTTAILLDDGTGTLLVDTVRDDLNAVERRSGRVTVFNGTSEPISVVQIESELFADSRKVNPIIQDIPAGESASVDALPEGIVNWTVIKSGTEQSVRDTMNVGDILARATGLRITRDTSQMLVVNQSRSSDGLLQPDVLFGGGLVADAAAAFGSPEAIGRLLFIDYLLPFQLVALLLLAAMVGVIVVAVREEHEPKPSRATRRKVSRPLTSVIAAQTGSDLSSAPRLPETAEQVETAGD